jgi:hypothetical protein
LGVLLAATRRSVRHDGASHRPCRIVAMTAVAGGHAIVIAADAPGEVAAGDGFCLSVRLSCVEGCDLSAVPIAVTMPDGTVAVFAPEAGQSPDAPRALSLTAPLALGTHVFRLGAADEGTGADAHIGTAIVPVYTRPHKTSLAVWDIPSPVIRGKPFAMKVGVKSSAGCDLCGRRISVLNEAGGVLASTALGATPWPGTDALYWSELTVPAPNTEGLLTWAVQCDAAGLSPPHRDAIARFSMAILAPPEHRLTVKVVDQMTAAGIPNAQLRLGAFRAATVEDGAAQLMLPTGAYNLTVWKPGYTSPEVAVRVDADAAIEVAVAALPEDDPDAAWQM